MTSELVTHGRCVRLGTLRIWRYLRDIRLQPSICPRPTYYPHLLELPGALSRPYGTQVSPNSPRWDATAVSSWCPVNFHLQIAANSVQSRENCGITEKVDTFFWRGMRRESWMVTASSWPFGMQSRSVPSFLVTNTNVNAHSVWAGSTTSMANMLLVSCPSNLSCAGKRSLWRWINQSFIWRDYFHWKVHQLDLTWIFSPHISKLWQQW